MHFRGVAGIWAPNLLSGQKNYPSGEGQTEIPDFWGQICAPNLLLVADLSLKPSRVGRGKKKKTGRARALAPLPSLAPLYVTNVSTFLYVCSFDVNLVKLHHAYPSI